MLLSLAVIVEELEKSHTIISVETKKELDKRFSLRGVRLFFGDVVVTSFDDDVLYVVSQKDAKTFDEQFCPKHFLMVCDGMKPVHFVMPVHSCEFVTAKASASPSQVFAEITELFESFSHWDTRLLQAIVGRQGIDAVLEIAAEKLANPIAFFDSTLSLVTKAGEFSGGYSGSIWEDVISNGFSPVEFYTREEKLLVSDGIKANAWPAVIRPERTPDHANLFASITVFDKQYGAIGQVDLVAPFSLGQIALAEHVRNRLQEYIALSSSLLEGADELIDNIVRIIEDKPFDLRLFNYYLRKKGWHPEDSFRLLLCPFESNDEWVLDQESRVRRIEKAIPKAITFLYEDSVVCLARSSDYSFVGEDCSEQLAQVLSDLEMICAVSEEYAPITKAAYAFRQCRMIIDEADSMVLEGVIPLEAVFENMVSGFLNESAQADAICHQVILDLVRSGYKGDFELGRELVTILYRYLIDGQNMCLCSRQLFMHRNTLAYRIGRLEEMLGMQFSELEPATILYLELSCLIALRMP